MDLSLHLTLIVDREAAHPYGRTLDLCQLAEDLGFRAVTVGNHHFQHLRYAGGVADPLLLLAAVAARTSTLELAQAVYLAALDDPLRLAERVAVLDELSGGRAVLSVGGGWNAEEYAAFGATLAERGRRLDEALAVIRRLWVEETVAHDGTFWRFPPLSLEPRPVRRPHPPIWVAGVADAALERAARLGDAWLCDPVVPFDEVARLVGRYRDRCAAAGSAADWVLRRDIWVGEDRRVMDDEWLPDYVDDRLAHWRASTEGPVERALFRRLDAGESVPPAEVAAGRFFGGTPDDVLEGIESYRRLGCEHLVVGLYPSRADRLHPDRAFAHVAGMLRTLGTHVVPALGQTG